MKDKSLAITFATMAVTIIIANILGAMLAKWLDITPLAAAWAIAVVGFAICGPVLVVAWWRLRQEEGER